MWTYLPAYDASAKTTIMALQTLCPSSQCPQELASLQVKCGSGIMLVEVAGHTAGLADGGRNGSVGFRLAWRQRGGDSMELGSCPLGAGDAPSR